MADSVVNPPEDVRSVETTVEPERAPSLLRRRDFRRVFLAVATSEVGDAFQYIALMWFALEAGGPLGVMAVRLADSVPALLFGFHGGLVADRWDRRRVMVAADLVRAAVLVPVAAAGLLGDLPLWGLVLAAFALTAARSYFDPSYGALLPALVDRPNVQQANSLVRASVEALTIGGWAVAAGLLAVLPISAFFALNAATFLASAALLATIAPRRAASGAKTGMRELAAGVAALRPHRALAVAVVVLGLAVTVSAGTWIVGVPELVRANLDRGAGGFSLVMVGYAVGAVTAGTVLARRPLRHKALGSLLAWLFYLPSYLVLGFADSSPVACAGAVLAALGQASAVVLVNSAAQEQVPDRVLGRVMGLVSLVHRGAHATGLLLVSPLFAVVAPGVVFVGAGGTIGAIGIAGAVVALTATRRGGEAPAPARNRSLRSRGRSRLLRRPRRPA
jgi:Transmembrane secretion effector